MVIEKNGPWYFEPMQTHFFAQPFDLVQNDGLEFVALANFGKGSLDKVRFQSFTKMIGGRDQEILELV
jgi:hypothetical protein